MAKLLDYWDYDRTATITCPSCGWSGVSSEHEELYDSLLDVCCPECGLMLLVVGYPTLEQTRRAAAAGNAEAQAELPKVERAEMRAVRARELELSDPKQLPNLEGREIVIDWDHLNGSPER